MKVASVLPQIMDSSPYMNVLRRRLKNEITQGEFDFEITSGAYSCREEFLYSHLPDMPADLREFREKYKFKFGKAKETLHERVMSSKQVIQFMEEYYGKIAKNMGNAYWLEQYIVIALVNLAYPIAEDFRKIYLDYPSDLRYVDGTIVWKKKTGEWWSKQVDEYRRRVYGNDEGSGLSETEGAGGELQSEVRQDSGPVKDQSNDSLQEAVPF